MLLSSRWMPLATDSIIVGRVEVVCKFYVGTVAHAVNLSYQLVFPNTSGLLQYSVTLAEVDSDTSTDGVVELQGAIEQVRYYYIPSSMHVSIVHSTLSDQVNFISMIRCHSTLLIFHLQPLQTLLGVFVTNTTAIVEDISETGAR